MFSFATCKLTSFLSRNWNRSSDGNSCQPKPGSWLPLKFICPTHPPQGTRRALGPLLISHGSYNTARLYTARPITAALPNSRLGPHGRSRPHYQQRCAAVQHDPLTTSHPTIHHTHAPDPLTARSHLPAHLARPNSGREPAHHPLATATHPTRGPAALDSQRHPPQHSRAQ